MYSQVARRRVGIDVGGASVRALTTGGKHIARRTVSPSTTLDQFLQTIGAVVEECGGADNIAIALPTFVSNDGRLMDCPSIPAITGVELAALLEPRLGCRPRLVPDLAAAAWGEAQLGSGRDVKRFLCVALGTGANAAAVVDGRLVDTAFGCLGDAGHIIVEPDGPSCPCGGRGCLEAVCSGWALAQVAAGLGLPNSAELARSAKAGDATAVAAFTRAGRALGRAIASWSALLWPDRVAIAGGLAEAGELLFGPACRELGLCGAPYVVGRIELVKAALAEQATLRGACLLAEG